MSIGAAWPDEAEVTARWHGEVPVVSVLCHAYNQRAYIEEALAGILCQRTDFPFEVILRDDASTDGTREVLQACAARYPRLVRLVLEPENRYRQGVKPVAATYPLARGEFIAMCEGDDRWLAADKLQAQVAFLRAAPDCGLVHSNYLNLILLGGAWKTRLALRTAAQRADRAGDIYAAMLQANRIQTCTAMWRRAAMAAYRESGPGVDGYLVGDWPLFLHLSRRARVGFIDAPLAAYRRAPGSLTNSGAASAVARGRDALRMVRDFCDYFDDPAPVRATALAAQYRTLLRLAYQAGDEAAFMQARTWLAAHAPRALASPARRWMAATHAHPRWRRATLGALRLVERIKHQAEFRATAESAR